MIGAITAFYSLLVVTLFVPVIGGLYIRRAGSPEAIAAIAAGVLTLPVVRFGVVGTLPVDGPGIDRDHRVRDCVFRSPVVSEALSSLGLDEMKTYRIAVIAGDGIGKEVVPAGIEIMKLAAEQGGFTCEFAPIPWGCDYYLQTGRMMDADGVDQLLKFDAIYLGAIGDPRVADHVSARELILPLRQKLGQWVNLRPMRLMPGISSPLAGRGAADIDMICVRENSEGEYCGMGGRLHAGTPYELAEQTGDLHPERHRAHRALRVPAGRVTSAEDARQRHQVERAAARDGAVG